MNILYWFLMFCFQRWRICHSFSLFVLFFIRQSLLHRYCTVRLCPSNSENCCWVTKAKMAVSGGWWRRHHYHTMMIFCFKKKIENFSQTVTAASFHTISGVFAWKLLYDKDWLWDTNAWADVESFRVVDAEFKFYYLLYAARYCSDLVSLAFEHARSVSSGNNKGYSIQ